MVGGTENPLKEGAEGQRFVQCREEKPKVDLVVVLRSGNREDVPDVSEVRMTKG